MPAISDNFVRTNGVLGGNWSAVVPSNIDAPGALNPPGGGILISNNGFGPINASATDGLAFWTGQAFGNDQWAFCQVKTVAAPTAVLSITAVSGSSSTWTYTYTVSSGSVTAPISGGALYVIIAGMQNAGNNGHFTATTFGSGTFTVTNASGVVESGSTGTGTCPSDSGGGVILRGSSVNGGNGYIFQAGTNSFSGDGRTGYHELWKIVNGVGTTLADGVTIPPSIGDVLGLTVIGTTLRAFVNGVQVLTVTDSSLSSGVPGIFTFSLSGPDEYNWSKWSSAGALGTPPGNNGTTFNNFQAGDSIGVLTQLVSDSMTEGTTLTQVAADSFQRGTVGNLGVNWSVNSTEGGGGFQLVANLVETTANAKHTYGYWGGGQTFDNDQYSEFTINTLAASNFTGPGVRMTSTATHGGTNGDGYLIQISAALGSSGSVVILKRSGGVQSTLATYTSKTINVGDVIRISAVGTTISAFQNGVSLGTPATDSVIISGLPGFWMDTNAAANCKISAWAAGGVGLPTKFSVQINQDWTSNSSLGAYPVVVDAINAQGFAGAFENTVSWPNDQYSRATQSAAAVATTFIGPAVRLSSSADTGYWISPLNDSTLRILEILAGVQTTIAQVPYTYTQNDILEIDAVGTTLFGKLNGTVVLMAVNSDISSGNSGFGANGIGTAVGTTKGTFSTWSAGSITNAPPSSNSYSVPDCRLHPNASRNVNGTLIYDVQTSSNPTIPPTDSRKAGAPVASGTYPQNSRSPGTFGPGE